MKKTVLSLILALVIMLSAVTAPVGAVVDDLADSSVEVPFSVIKELRLSGVAGCAPVNGLRPSNNFMISSTYQQYYSLLATQWWNLSLDRAMLTDEKISNNYIYAVRADFMARGDNHYKFSSDLEHMTSVYLSSELDKYVTARIIYNIDNGEESIRRVYYIFRIDKDSDRPILIYEPNGGSGSMRPVAVPFSGRVTLPECGFTPPEGKMFYKWGEMDPGESVLITNGGIARVAATWMESTAGKTKVSSVSVSITDPRAGQKPDNQFSVPSADKNKYKVKGIKWINGAFSRDMYSNETFNANTPYALEVTYVPLDGYYFDSLENMTASLNNVSSQEVTYTIYESGLEAGYPNRFVRYYFGPPSYYLDELKMTVNAPRAGDNPDYKIYYKSESNLSAEVVDWYESSDQNSLGNSMYYYETFKPGKYYYVDIHVHTAVRYALEKTAAVTVNGNSAAIASGSLSYIDRTYRCKFKTPAAGAEVSSLSATLGGMTVGEYLPDSVTTSDSRYTVSIAGWYTGGTVSAPTNQITPQNRVIADKQYFVKIKFTPKFGQAFTDSPTATINGKTAVRNGAAADHDGSIYFCLAVKASSGESYIMGDIDASGEVNAKDARILSRYIAGWDNYATLIVNMDAADLDGVGGVTAKDARILSRCIAGWDGYRSNYLITVTK